MVAGIADKNELLTAIAAEFLKMQRLFSALPESLVNTVPFKDSWTAAQLLSHVTRSTELMAKAMLMNGTSTERDPGEKIPGLKKTFLDFSTRMTSPDIISPDLGTYEKPRTINELKDSLEVFKQNANNANLTDLVEGLPFGPVTKLEITHFVLYHTQRHLQQMEKICDALQGERNDKV
ncbi:MAG: DinB family protein [Ferruginibacter sp.]|nr:DinB family protein [Ferruginibacter sp.]